MVRVSKLFVGDFIRGAELKGNEVIVEILGEGEIMATQFKDSKGRTKEQLVIPVRFQGEVRKLGINKTSLKKIAIEYSEESDKWYGKHLILRPEKKSIGEKEIVVIWVGPVMKDSIRDNLFSTAKDKDIIEETQEEKDNWERI